MPCYHLSDETDIDHFNSAATNQGGRKEVLLSDRLKYVFNSILVIFNFVK
jgi:hypothetical protein